MLCCKYIYPTHLPPFDWPSIDQVLALVVSLHEAKTLHAHSWLFNGIRSPCCYAAVACPHFLLQQRSWGVYHPVDAVYKCFKDRFFPGESMLSPHSWLFNGICSPCCYAAVACPHFLLQQRSGESKRFTSRASSLHNLCPSIKPKT